MEIKKVSIIGAGLLGSQIAWQTAFRGFDVMVYDAYEKGIETSKGFHSKFADLFQLQYGATPKQIEATFSRLSYTTQLKEAVADADIISESVPENLELKKSVYAEISKYAPPKTIFTTNSSTFLPSVLATETDRPEKFLALHFANSIWDSNIGEVMMHSGTDQKYFDIVLQFTKDIGLVPIPIYKEQSGYVLNSLLGPLLSAAQHLLFGDVTDFKSIDKTWMIGTGAKIGPFGMIDIIGMQTVFNVMMLKGIQTNDRIMISRAKRIKREWIDHGKTGVSSGQGFYSYPNPAYEDPNFLLE